jgi:two-component system NtrC family sensor kinase
MNATARERLSWQLATESIVVRIRWFGIAMGYILVQTRTGLHDPSAVRAFLALGAGYAALDTAFHRMGEVFLQRWPLFTSAMEGLFIALLCYHDVGLSSPFRWYYLLSLICCAIRYRPAIAWWTFGMHCLSLSVLAVTMRASPEEISDLAMTAVILAWATWATSSLSSLVNHASDRLVETNAALVEHRNELETRVKERTEALRASQARVLHQEKMAAFGLLAAGIAHEVGNPLAAISSLVQILQRRDLDPDTRGKLDEVARQIDRIRRTIREVVDFSRPSSSVRGRVRLSEVVDEALNIARYAHRTRLRELTTDVPPDLPAVLAVRDHLVQVVLNLVLNAIDATERGGRIHVAARLDGGALVIGVEDDGRGVAPENRLRLFQPYFTTKGRGTGLGLFVSRQIIEEHHGTIAYEPAPERGSIFRVRLPVPAPATPHRPALVEEVAS